MKNNNYFRNKKITVIGIARSGIACANLLSSLGAKVSITDIHDNEQTRKNLKKITSKDIQVELGGHSRDFVRGRDLIVISPGVDNLSPAVIMAEEFKIPVISEIEVGSLLCQGTIIAVTGSNGKTTVTTLTAKVLEAAKKNVYICGNIGEPFCAKVKDIKSQDYVCLEISSFQLERIVYFKPKIAVILNLTPNHLDRYRDMSEYTEAKKRIFMNQDKDDFLILNSEDKLLKGLANEAKSKILFFKQDDSFNPNQAAVLAISTVLNIDKKICRKVFFDFKGVEHRMEKAGSIKGVEFINDSKATTVNSTLWALAILKTPVILIAGGKDKGLDYGLLIPSAKHKIKHIVLIGEARKKIKEALGDHFKIKEADNLKEAVGLAFAAAERGDAVLFSPMCASFDMFTDYEDRGRKFKSEVLKLAKEKK